MFDRENVKKLLVDLGHAINRNNGQCYETELVLCRATTLCTDILKYFDECDPQGNSNGLGKAGGK